MTDVVTYLVEAGVGLVTAATAITLWRAERRWLGATLLVAGVAAVVHAVVRLAV